MTHFHGMCWVKGNGTSKVLTLKSACVSHKHCSITDSIPVLMNAGFYSTSGGIGDRECGYWTGIMNSAKVGVQNSLLTLMKFVKICTTEMAYLPQNMFCSDVIITSIWTCNPPFFPCTCHGSSISHTTFRKCKMLQDLKCIYFQRPSELYLPLVSWTTHLLTFSNHAGSH